ncbi:MAG: ABC transporter substrate-binding protein [Chloroflexota bacterium]|nr:ABC transporter substrate-binding protein [Chloroflexota bacterium]
MKHRPWLIPVVTGVVLVLAACGGGAAAPSSAAPATASAAPASSSARPASSSAAASSKPAVSSAAASSSAAPGAKPTVRIGSTNFSEQAVLGELYGQVLEANGFKVERHFNLGNREIVEPALESGKIDMDAEYLATLLAFVDKKAKPSTDPAETKKALEAALQPKGLAVLDYAPAVDTNGFVVTKATADKYHLAKLSDLAPIGNQLILGGPAECPQRPFCQVGLQKTYGIKFKDFKSLDAGGPLTVAALQGNQIDVGLLFTSDPTITAKAFVLLDDDKHLQLSDNVAPVVRSDLLSKAGPDFPKLLNSVSAKLTTAQLTNLNKQVGVDKKDAKDVAAAWLKSQGLVK